jgi:hypothetical protein
MTYQVVQEVHAFLVSSLEVQAILYHLFIKEK